MVNIRNIEVGHLQTPPVVISPLESASKLLGIFKDLNVYEAFIQNKDKVAMITARDILNVTNITSAKIGSLITYVPKLSPTSKIGEAANVMMQYRIRALPIVQNEKLIGAITANSIISLIKENANEFSNVKAKDLMTNNPITISKSDLASKARRIMTRRKLDHLPVLSGSKKLAGMLTSTHLILSMLPSESAQIGARGLENSRRFNFPVENLMDPYPATCNLESNISTVIGTMLDKKLTYSVVMLWEEIQGIVTIRNVVKLAAEPKRDSEIPIYIIGLPNDPFEAEVAKNKFIRTVNLLGKSISSIQEARSVIKSSTSIKGKERRRYEVNVSIKTPKKMFKFSEIGWDLPKIYELIGDRLKRILAQKTTKTRIHREGMEF